LNKQQRIALKGGPPAVLLKTLRRKKIEFLTKFSKEHWTWTESLDKRPRRQNMDMRFGTWNIVEERKITPRRLLVSCKGKSGALGSLVVKALCCKH
jgi:hypothetical protein